MRPSGPIYHEAIVLVILTTSEPNIADQNPATMKLSSIEATRPNMAAFNTNRKRPSVMIVIGRVSKNAMGRTKPLTRQSRTAARITLPVPSMVTPGIIAEARSRPSSVISVLRKNPCMSL